MKRSPWAKAALSCAFALVSATAAATDYYVSAESGASDNNDGLSAESPFATVDKAIASAANASDVIHVEERLLYFAVLETAAHDALVVLNAGIALAVGHGIHAVGAHGAVFAVGEFFEIELGHSRGDYHKRYKQGKQLLEMHTQ